MDRGRLTVAFLNLGHFLDHLAMLIYATAVLAMTNHRRSWMSSLSRRGG